MLARPALFACLAAPAAAQLPTAELIALSDPAATVPGSLVDLSNITGGEDQGWCAWATFLDGSGAPVGGLFGEIVDDDPLGPRLLRVPEVVGGLTQTFLYAPRLADRRLGYLAQVDGGAPGTAAFVNDVVVVLTGDPIGAGETWTGFESIQPLIGGGTMVKGRTGGGPIQSPKLARYPAGQIVLEAGMPVGGTTESILFVLSTDVSPSGNHVAATVTLGPSGRRGVILDGNLVQLSGGALALSGSSAAPALPPTPANAAATFSFFRSIFVDDAGTVTLDAALDDGGLFTRDVVIRGGREIGDTSGLLRGTDLMGGALTSTEQFLPEIEFDGEAIDLTSRGVDLNDDGLAETQIRIELLSGAPSISGSARVYSTARLEFPGGASRRGLVRVALKPDRAVVCPGAPNVLARGAALHAVGSPWVGYNRMKLVAFHLPQDTSVLPLVSRASSMPTSVPGSAGPLCLGGEIGRVLPGLFTSSFGGTGTVDLFLNALPQGQGYVSAVAGETWYAQLWYRDFAFGSTSNFSDAIAISFR